MTGALFRLLTFRRVSCWELPGSPQALAALVLAGLVIGALPGLAGSEPWFSLDGPAVAALMAIAAALIAAWLTGQAAAALRFGFAFTFVALLAFVLIDEQLGGLVLGLFDVSWLRSVIAGAAVGIAARFTLANAGWRRGSRLAAALGVPALLMLPGLLYSDIQMNLALALYEERAEAEQPGADIDAESLWTAQPRLMQTAQARLPGPDGSPAILTVAAGGSQEIFGREARAVRERLEGALEQGGHGLTLSNAGADLAALPMANRTNLTAILSAMAARQRGEGDLAVIYLASHGSEDAELSTNLPQYQELKPISAAHLAAELDRLGIRRRIVIVSACYSGTWIKPLASDRTIVLTASAADRTSFGCDDSRRHTVFGEAMVNALADPTRTLEQAFAHARAEIEANEASSGQTPSRPQSDVGSMMQEAWRSPLRCLGQRRAGCR